MRTETQLTVQREKPRKKRGPVIFGTIHAQPALRAARDHPGLAQLHTRKLARTGLLRFLRLVTVRPGARGFDAVERERQQPNVLAVVGDSLLSRRLYG